MEVFYSVLPAFINILRLWQDTDLDVSVLPLVMGTERALANPCHRALPPLDVFAAIQDNGTEAFLLPALRRRKDGAARIFLFQFLGKQPPRIHILPVPVPR